MDFEILDRLRDVETIATGRAIRELRRLQPIYGPGRWRKRKGTSGVRLADGTFVLPKYIEISVTVRPRSDFAYATFIERATLTPKAGSLVVDDNLRTTQIYEKRNGHWVIVHEHKSQSRTA